MAGGATRSQEPRAPGDADPLDPGGPDTGRRTPARRHAWYVELATLVVVLVLFGYLHALAGKAVGAAAAHGSTVQTIERALHLDVERAVNAWLAGGPTWAQLVAVYVYRSYYLVVAGVLMWLYARRPESYLVARRTLVTMLALVLAVYWAVPLAPPRFALPGVVDVVALHDPFGHGAARASGNLYSAMPSLHVGLAAWCAYAVWHALRRSHPRAAWLAWLFPLLMVAVVLTTGNHYVLDVVGAAAVLAVSVVVAREWGRLASRRT
jgi:hypothetical protein